VAGIWATPRVKACFQQSSVIAPDNLPALDNVPRYDKVYIYITSYRGGTLMRMELEGTLLKMTPENDREKEELNQLWTIIIGCVSEGKRLVPVGEYLPGIKEVAVFNIE
jgi:hypothetical protein